MNKKKLLYSIYTVVFMGICLVPAVMTPIEKSDASLENRTLAELPKFRTEDGKFNFEFFSEFETYFSENFGLRQKLVTLDGKLRAEVMGSSSNEDVIIGKDDWLYYTPTSDDFMNTNVLSDRAISNIDHNLTLLSNYCNEQGAEFIFTVAPNKNSIYPEYMPYNYIETDNSGNLEKLGIKQAQSQSYTYVDLKAVLLEEKAQSELPLYHTTDTHWNNVGALAARNALLTIGEENDALSNSSWTAKADWSGDLAEMIYPADVPMDNQFYTDYSFNFSYVGRFRSFDEISIKTTCEGRDGNLFMYRDSFGEAIIPFMAESFAAAEFSRAVPYNTMNITDGTTVILEIVERNIGNLQKYAPIMPAPVYEGEVPEGKSGTGVTYKSEASGSYIHVYGELTDEFFSGDSARIIVTADGVSYEAFNCFEDEKLGREGEISDNGFSLYIPKSNEQQTDFETISVTAVSADGTAVTSVIK
ncbi:MAG: hypothetical protein IJX77_01240 [Ruminococcus sp.]|nr:hypothetical protein [Ruminococcus sp.]